MGRSVTALLKGASGERVERDTHKKKRPKLLIARATYVLRDCESGWRGRPAQSTKEGKEMARL